MSEKHSGSCHCGAVRFVVHADLSTGASRCNCSICLKLGAVGRTVKPNAFELLTDRDALGAYTWRSEQAHRYFCKRCGVYVFGDGNVPELGGDFVSFNVNCLDDVDPNALPLVHWDGRHDNWHAGPRDRPWPIA